MFFENYMIFRRQDNESNRDYLQKVWVIKKGEKFWNGHSWGVLKYADYYHTKKDLLNVYIILKKDGEKAIQVEIPVVS